MNREIVFHTAFSCFKVKFSKVDDHSALTWDSDLPDFVLVELITFIKVVS